MKRRSSSDSGSSSRRGVLVCLGNVGSKEKLVDADGITDIPYPREPFCFCWTVQLMDDWLLIFA